MTRPAEHRPRPVRFAAGLACALLAAAACGAGCNGKSPTPGGPSGSKANQARQQAEKTVMAGARAVGEFVAADPSNTVPVSVTAPTAPVPPRAPIAPSVSPRPTPTVRPLDEPVIRERVSSELPHPTEADADRDAVEQAGRRLTEKLAELDPPVRFYPSPTEIKAFIRKGSRSVRPLTEEQKETYTEAGLKDNVLDKMVFVDYEVVVSSEQVRELRSRERVVFGIKALAGIAFAALAGFLFLRADEWTKGYLTSWLAVAAFALASGVAATLALV